jgi:hypothetical protein
MPSHTHTQQRKQHTQTKVREDYYAAHHHHHHHKTNHHANHLENTYAKPTANGASELVKRVKAMVKQVG